ncbi:O-acetyl-ADP-ribose deacetylase (regulator of RNase III) [Motilibacter peucedani]|uniref:O-acetyl-ADP-ribose deacetylase (Regulator of RNase III) n=1 Tax=Motilibacter peucedani TaxID=598650 RepID=A0A420XN72_9ACTN|nr:macro domain-containing protein [Motilibacter peucedani]RKS72726.1 O-acetyl-ADP-ribose deacetylase (regulator of RNase III) [Motilibacter peucedani]
MRVRLLLGTPESEACDALVRIAPPELVGRTPDRVLAAAGAEVTALCRALRHDVFRRGVPEGEAVTTPGGDLPARWLVHVVVPAWSVRDERRWLLARCYRSVLAAADDVGARELVMAPLGTHAPYWPLDVLVGTCLGTVLNTPTRVEEVRLVLASASVLERFAEALARR